MGSKKEGFKLFCLGGGKTPDPDDTLLRFKKRFSKKYFNFFTGKKIHNKEMYDFLCQKKLQYENKNHINSINEDFFPVYFR